MADYKVIKGQAWIDGKSLVQEQIMIIPGKSAITNTIVLVEDIWEDLKSASGTYKTKDNKYFYWEYKMTDSENDDVEIDVKYECPKPKIGVFPEPYDPETVEGEYAKYWVGRMKEASENYEKAYAIQRKEILLKGTEYMDQEGNIATIEDSVESNTNLGDIMNLLNLF
jgi:hypothetical protein